MSEWQLTGRTAEVDLITRYLHDARYHGVVVFGPAGVGKTRIAREFERNAQRAGFETAWAVGSVSASRLPFGALATLVPDLVTGEPVESANWSATLRRTATGLLARAHGRPLVLVVDDAHLLDDASATLLHQLAVPGSCFVVLTIRTSEMPPEYVTALWRDGVAARMDLAGLESPMVEKILEKVLGSQLDPSATAEIVRHSQGNARFMQAIVEGALHDGTLCERYGVWYLDGALTPSERLIELVEADLGTLDRRSRELLELVSYGEPVTEDQLNAVADPTHVEQLERKGLLTGELERGRLTFRIAHQAHCDVLRSVMPRTRVRALARLMAAAAGPADTPDDKLRLAKWKVDAGEANADPILEGAEIARWRYDFSLARQLADAAVGLRAGFEERLLAAQVTGLGGEPTLAEQQLAELAAQCLSDEQRGRVACARMDNWVFSMGKGSEGVRVAQEAEAAITDPQWRDQVAARRTATLIAADGPGAAVKEAQPLFERAVGTAKVYAALPTSFSLARLGRITEGLAVSTEAYRLHTNLDEPLQWYPWIHLWLRCQGLAAAGRFAEAESLARLEYEKGLADDCPEARAFFCWYLASTVGARGDVRVAEARAREGLMLFRQLGQSNFCSSVAVPLATALALSGEPDRAERVFTMEGMSPDPAVWNGVERIIAHAWISVARGDVPGARARLEEAAMLGETIGDLLGAATALHDLVRLGDTGSCVERLARLAEDVEGELVSNQLMHAQALRAADADQLQVVSSSFSAIGARLLAAESAFDAAVAWQRHSMPRRAVAAERRAQTLLAACEGARTPATQHIMPRANLTKAERDTALLAAAGHTNRDIAELQTLSIRTVQNRLYHVYGKLGVSSREELDTILRLELPVANSPYMQEKRDGSPSERYPV